jgi:hypothetical protein
VHLEEMDCRVMMWMGWAQSCVTKGLELVALSLHCATIVLVIQGKFSICIDNKMSVSALPCQCSDHTFIYCLCIGAEGEGR